jgi:hypothetical protein
LRKAVKISATLPADFSAMQSNSGDG